MFSGSGMGLLFAAYAIGLMLATPNIGVMFDRLGSKPPMVMGLVGGGLSELLFA
jgi:MFS family permease